MFGLVDPADVRYVFISAIAACTSRGRRWDSPTTRGVLDTSTGVCWAVDAFATPCSTAVEASVGELDALPAA